jgi:spore germination protein KC
MPMRKALLLLLALSVALLTGCWDRRELEERTSLVAIGIDRVKGKKELYKVSVQIPIPIKIAGREGQGGGGSESAVKVMSVSGRSVSDALNNLQKRLNQRIFIGHTRVLAISEEVAREGMAEILDGFRRAPEMRRLLWPIVVKGEASDLLKINPKLVQIPVMYIMELIESGAKAGMIPDQSLNNFFVETSTQSLETYLNYVEAYKDEIIWKGLAVFRDQKMAGVLDDVQSWVLLQLREKMRGGDVVIPLPERKDDFITFRPHFVKSKLKILEQKGQYEAVYHVTLQGDIIETTVSPNVIEEKYNIEKLQDLVRGEMDKRAAKLLKQLQKDFKIDVLKLGMALRAHHYRDYWVKHDWEKEFPPFKIRILYTIKIRRFGMEMK